MFSETTLPATGSDGMSVSALKSNFWSGVDSFSADSKYRQRATRFFEKFKWDALLLHCSRSRDGVDAHFSQNFSIGDFNLVRRVSFMDGVQWIVRLRMPERPHGSPQTQDIQRSMSTEMAAILYLSTHTRIPVPALHGYNFDPQNEFGAPYMIMEYIDGVTAYEMRRKKGSRPGMFGTPDQDLSFRKQMAAIHAEVASHRFDKIGSLMYNEDSGDFTIGPDLMTGQGPWASSLAYYNATANHAFRVALTQFNPEIEMTHSATLPLVFQQLIASHCTKVSGPFCLTNRDFGAHNLLVNDDFEIVGVIDLDGLMAAPVELTAQFPRLTGLSRPTPGLKETRPAAIERLKLVEKQLEQYRDLLRDAEVSIQAKPRDKVECSAVSRMEPAKEPPDEDARDTVSSLMFSDSASIVQGLLEYNSYIEATSDGWMNFYLRLLVQRIKQENETSL